MAAVADVPELHIATDEFTKFKQYERQIEHADVMIEYLKVELRSLERELLHAQEEVNYSFNQNKVFNFSWT